MKESLSVELKPLGEIRMGCEAYGIVIKTKKGIFDTFSNIPVLVGTEDYSECLEQSSCMQYVLLYGAFGTYILDIENQAVSAYKTTVRTLKGEWSEEQAIFGSEKKHINGFSRHIYLQFPFVSKNEFLTVLKKYESFREQQIEEAVNAI